MTNKILTKEMEQKLALLNALQNGGVDNWDGYDFATEEYFKTIGHEEKVEQLVDDLFAEIHEYIEEPAGRNAGYGIREKGYEIAVEFLLKRIGELK